MIKRYLYTVLFAFCCLFGYAQDYFRQADIYDMHLLNQQAGLDNNTLTGIYQDKDGFMWLGSDVGLNRYDGIHFHNYTQQRREPETIGDIIEDDNRLLWLKIKGKNRIVCFDKMQECYLTLHSDMPGLLNDIKEIIRVRNKLYVATSQGVAELLSDFEGEDLKVSFRLLPETPSDVCRLRSGANSFYALTADRKIFIYDIATQKGKYIACDDLNIDRDIPIDDIYAFNGYIWICLRWAGGICYDPASGEYRNVIYTSGKSGYNSMYIRDVTQINPTHFIVATHNTLYQLTFEGEDFIHSAYAIESLAPQVERYAPALNNGITRVYYDKKNAVLWVGTFGRGLLKLNIGKKLLQRIQIENAEVNVIKSITQDAKGYIWLATEQNGIYRSNEHEVDNTMKFSRWEKTTVDSDYCIYKDKNGHLWVGDLKGNIFCINTISEETVAYHPSLPDNKPLKGVSFLYLNTRGYLWIATDENLIIYDYKNNQVMKCIPYSERLAAVTAIREDGDGTMWLGTKKGLVTMKYDKDVDDFVGGYEADAGLEPGEVLALYINNYNQIFVSYVNKILQIDGKEKKVISNLLLSKDFANGHINCMMDDGNGNTWLGTNSGLITINNKTNSSYNYSFPENYNDVCLLNNGYLLWASSSGLLCFDPRLLKEESDNRKLFISDIDVNYKRVGIGEKVNGQVILDKPVFQTEHLDLNYRNNNLVIYLSDLKYGNISNRVEYRLLPDDKEWKSSSEYQIAISNLASGDYTLEIRPVSPLNIDALVTRLTFSVGEYWAASGWAVTLYLLVGGLLSWLVWYYMSRRKLKRTGYLQQEAKLKERLEEEKQKREEVQKLNVARDQVRLMLAKELRTPLSLIIAPLKEMIEDKHFPSSLLQKAEIAYRSSVSIQDVCNQLFGIYEQREIDYKLNVAPCSVSNLANGIVHSYYELLNSCPITLYYNKEKNIDLDIWVDYKRIMFVLQCIFSNAYRHISYSGSIWFTINTAEIDNKSYCLFVVKDNGHIEEEEVSVKYLSESGYEVEDKVSHRELALDMMKEMAMAHHGDIKISRQKDDGTTVTLYIPLGKEHFEGGENVSFVEREEISLDEKVSGSIDTLVQNPDIIPMEEEVKQLQTTVMPNKKFTLLVIEDHPDIRTYLKVLFSSEYNILEADNGENGLELARKELPDLIITDVMMPVMDGFECCRILKEDLSTCHIPIVLLTALADDKDVVKGIGLGADEYIYKPFNPEILRIKVKRLIKSRIELKQIYTKLLMPSENGDEQGAEEMKAEDPFIEQILEMTNQNLQNPNFSVKWLAENLNMSQATLYRRIKQSTDFSLIELVRGVRLKRAAELLRTKKYSVQEVAEMVGYNDIPTFRKHFVDFYGTTPSTFNREASE